MCGQYVSAAVLQIELPGPPLISKVGKLPFSIWGKTFADQMAKMKEATYSASHVPYNIVKKQFVSIEFFA